MARIILKKQDDVKKVLLKDVPETTTIFAEREGHVIGVVLHVFNKGWTLMLGSGFSDFDYYSSRLRCVDNGIDRKYEFFTKD